MRQSDRVILRRLTGSLNGVLAKSQKGVGGGSTLENQDFLRAFLAHFSRISQKGNGAPRLQTFAGASAQAKVCHAVVSEGGTLLA